MHTKRERLLNIRIKKASSIKWKCIIRKTLTLTCAISVNVITGVSTGQSAKTHCCQTTTSTLPPPTSTFLERSERDVDTTNNVRWRSNRSSATKRSHLSTQCWHATSQSKYVQGNDSRRPIAFRCPHHAHTRMYRRMINNKKSTLRSDKLWSLMKCQPN